MRRPTRLIGVIPAVLLLGVLGVPAPAHAGSQVAGGTRVTLYDGDGKFLVFEAETSGRFDSPVYVVDARRNVRRVHHAKSGRGGSVAGHYFVAPAAVSRAGVRWYNLDTGHHGFSPVPSTEQFEGATPSGWLVLDTADRRFLTVTPSGKRTDLGSEPTRTVTGILTGPTGFVFTTHSAIHFVPYSKRAKRSTFKPDLAPKEGVSCSAVSATAIACVASSQHCPCGDLPRYVYRPLYIPLDGGKIRTETKVYDAESPYLVHRALGWLQPGTARFATLTAKGRFIEAPEPHWARQSLISVGALAGVVMVRRHPDGHESIVLTNVALAKHHTVFATH
jgi:hypothetical protein